MVSPFERRRLERIEEIRASGGKIAEPVPPPAPKINAYQARNNEVLRIREPLPPRVPKSPPPRAPELLTVSRGVLITCLDALQADQAPNRAERLRFAAELIRRELGG